MTATRVVILGGGVIGFASARQIARRFALRSKTKLDLFLLEKNPSFGQETTSRNSGVLHAGIYYQQDSFKHKLCVAGHSQLLKFCDQYQVDYDLCGKLIVQDRCGSSPEENKTAKEELLKLYHQGKELNNVPKLELITDDSARLQRMTNQLLNPEIKNAIYSPATGILDVHGYLLALQAALEEEESDFVNASVVYNCGLEQLEVKSENKAGNSNTSTKMQIETTQGVIEDVDVFVNCSGLFSVEIAKHCLRGVPSPVEELLPDAVYAKGNYWKLENSASSSTTSTSSTAKAKKPGDVNHLIYPLPEVGGLGTHLTLDLDKNVKFGPNVEWIEIEEIETDAGGKSSSSHLSRKLSNLEKQFETHYKQVQPASDIVYENIRRYYPDLPDHSLTPDYVGIRPKIKLKSDPASGGETSKIHNDFHFLTDGTKNSQIHCLGIESPGLTSSLAIGAHVADLVVGKAFS
ncbi:unnamed protein product [Amoebophrya sp. A120]|nr:unnamed protein product [Amoebophrya sp. A120]|eukprot:GSA120T00013249001.1